MFNLLLTAAFFHSPGLSCTAHDRRIVVSFPRPDADVELRRGQFAIAEEGRLAPSGTVIVVDPPDRFSSYRWNTPQLIIDIDRQRGVIYDTGGRRHIVRAFPHSGRYRLIFADILETEEENMASIECVVRVVTQARHR